MPSNPISSYKSVCQRKTLRLWVAFRDKCTPSPSVVKPMISCTTSEINRDKRSLPVRLGELPGRSLSFGTILPLYPPKTYSELLKTCGTETGTAAGGNLLVSYLWILGENLLSQNLHQGFGENQCNNAYLSSVTLPGAGWILYFVVVPPLLVEHNQTTTRLAYNTWKKSQIAPNTGGRNLLDDDDTMKTNITSEQVNFIFALLTFIFSHTPRICWVLGGSSPYSWTIPQLEGLRIKITCCWFHRFLS
jgi:hypothetical protein